MTTQKSVAALLDLEAGQREPDERVREALFYADTVDPASVEILRICAARHINALAAELRRLQAREAVYEERLASMFGTIAEQAGRLQAAQREPHPQRDDLCDCIVGLSPHPRGPKCVGAQQDDHPLLREARDYILEHGDERTMAPLVERIDAALAASKGTPDSMGQGGLKDSGVSSQCHGEVAEPKKPDPLDEACPKCRSIPGERCRDEMGHPCWHHPSRIRKANGRSRRASRSKRK